VACSDRRPYLPWTSPNQHGDDTTPGQAGGSAAAMGLQEAWLRRGPKPGRTHKKGRPERRPFDMH